MGACLSSSRHHLTPTPPTAAKVITPSGLLREFSSPIAASLVLGDDELSFFVCNSDSLFFDECVPPLRPRECLLPGNLYFVLPVKMLHSPLSAVEMASLAIKARDALSDKEGKGKKMKKTKNKKVIPVSADPPVSKGNAGASLLPDVKKVIPSRKRATTMGSKLVRRLSYRLRLSTIEESPEQ